MTTNEVTITLQDGMHFTSEREDGQTIHLDSRPDFGGQGLGVRPKPLLLVSLAACTGMDVLSILRKKRQDVTGFDITVTAEQAETHPKVYTSIAIKYMVQGNDISPKAVEKAIHLSITKYCPVANMLIQVVPIDTSYEIIGA